MQIIKIALAGSVWLDLINDLVIGHRHDLIEYVNKLRLVVENDDCFLDTHLFWYKANPYAWTDVFREINEAYRTATDDKWKLPYIAVTPEYITTHFLNPTTYDRESEPNSVEKMGLMSALKQACIVALRNKQDVAARVKKKRNPSRIKFKRTATKI